MMLPDFMQCLLFCINSTDHKLFKIIFLFETTFNFPQLYLSREVCMIYLDFLLAKRLSVPFVGVSTPLWPWCLGLLIYGDPKLQYLDAIYAFHKSHFRDQRPKLYLAT